MPTVLTILLAWTTVSVVATVPLARFLATGAATEGALVPAPLAPGERAA